MDIAAETLDLERRFWRAMVDNDAKAASELAANPCLVTGAQGVSRIDRKTFAKMMEGAAWRLHDFEFSEVKVEDIADGVAIIAYKVREDVTVDGERMTMEAADASTWVRGPEGWTCALHTESVLGDPFGRAARRAGPAA